MVNSLERHVANHIKTLPNIEFCLIGDFEIVKKYGKYAFGIDILFKIDRYFVVIQCKAERTKPKLKDIRQFLGATNDLRDKYLNSNTQQKLLVALFVSLQPMTTNGLDLLQNQNDQYASDLFISIHNSNSEQDLAQQVFNFIVNKLKNVGVYKLTTAITMLSTMGRDLLFKLKPHQQKVINTFETDYLDGSLKRGVVCTPTGTGKSIMALAMINAFWIKTKYAQRSVIWITERKEILYSQFENSQLDDLINSGLFPDYDFFTFITWYNKKSDIDYLNNELQKDKPVFLVTNVDCIMYKLRYTSILHDKFGMVVFDEMHHSGADQTFSMLDYFCTAWARLSFLIGFSATPIPMNKTNVKNILTLFGNGQKLNFIELITLFDAIDLGIIVPIDFHWVECTFNNKISSDQIIKNIKDAEKKQILNYIQQILDQSHTKTVLAWSCMTDNADEWKIILKDAFPSYQIFISHSKIKGNEEMQQFLMCEKPCILLCVDRCQEGFDHAKIDTALNLEPVETRSILKFVQQTGRVVRTYSGKQKGQMMEPFVFVDEETKIEQICNIIIEYFLFLIQINVTNSNPDFSSTLNQLKNSLVIDSQKSKGIFKTSRGQKVCFNFSLLNCSLKSLEWHKISEKIEPALLRKLYPNKISYEAAKNIIVAKIPNPKDRSKQAYYDLCQKDSRLPSDPENEFQDQLNWIDFLNLNGSSQEPSHPIFYTFEQCQQKANEYLDQKPELKDVFNKLKICHTLCSMDKKFPPFDLWCEYYNLKSLDEILDWSDDSFFDDIF